MTNRARGTFEVTVLPQSDEQATSAGFARLTIDKTFAGDLAGTSKGQMLAAVTAVQGSAGYVAIERVEATLHGKKGAFVLQHTGTMTRGAPALEVTVVPDSATDELAGLSGKMSIIIDGKKHSYEFDYSLGV